MSNINVNNLTPLLGSGSSVSVSGSLVVKNDVTIGGHLYIGDQDTDSVTFSAEVSSSVIPDATITYDLGSAAKQWRSIYVNSLVVHHITASGNISASGTGINGTGSFHHVTVNGNVTSSGTASFEGGFFSTNGTGSLAYVSVSGDMDIAGHISGSRISASAGLEVDHTGSFRYISSSGDLTASGTGSFGGGIDSSTATGSFGQVTAVGDVSSSATGSFMDVFIDDNLEVQGDINLHGNISASGTATASFGHISASGDISTSTAVHSVQYFTDSLLALTGNQAINTVKLGGNSSVTQLHGLSVDITGSISASSDMTIVGDISSSGRISASSGFETDAGTTSNFGTISSSGNLIISGDISASRVSASAGFEADTDSKSTFGHISMSGDLQIGNNTVVISGSGGQITASGHISGGANIFAAQYFVGSGGAMSVLSGDGGANTVKMGGASSGTQIHGISIDVTGSISMSGALSMSGANADIITEGAIYGLGDISSSATLLGTDLTLASAGINALTVAADGDLATTGVISSSNTNPSIFRALSLKTNGISAIDLVANGVVSASATVQGTSFKAQSAGDTKFVVDTSGNVSSSGTLAGTALDIRTDGVQKASVTADGTGSFLGGIDAGAGNATGSFGYVSASGDISTSANVHAVQYFTDSLIFATGDQGSNTVKMGGASSVTQLHGLSVDVTGSISMSGALSMSGANAEIITEGGIYALGKISSSAGLSGTALTLTTAGVHKASIDASGNVAAEGGISSSATLSGTSLNIKTAGVTKTRIDASGNIAAEGIISSSTTLAARNLDIKSAGVTLASIDTSGNLDLIAGNEAGATGSFGYISMSGDFSASGNITASGVYADGDVSASGAVFTKFIKPNAGATLNITPDSGAAFASDTHTVQIYGGLRAGSAITTAHTILGPTTIASLVDLTPTFETKTANFTAAVGREYIVNKADGAAIVLPAAAIGARITILIGTLITSNTTTITAASGDLLKGYAFLEATDAANNKTLFVPDGSDDLIITLDGSTTGGLIGDRIELVGISATEWRVRATLSHTSTAATPFS